MNVVSPVANIKDIKPNSLVEILDTNRNITFLKKVYNENKQLYNFPKHFTSDVFAFLAITNKQYIVEYLDTLFGDNYIAPMNKIIKIDVAIDDIQNYPDYIHDNKLDVDYDPKEVYDFNLMVDVDISDLALKVIK